MSSKSESLQNAALEHHTEAHEFRLSPPFDGAVVRYSRPRTASSTSTAPSCPTPCAVKEWLKSSWKASYNTPRTSNYR